MLGILDGSVMPAEQIQIPATDEGLLRGDGVFEVMRLYDGRPFAVDDHLERMERSAREPALPIDAGAVRADIEALLERRAPRRRRAARPRHPRRAPASGFIEPVPGAARHDRAEDDHRTRRRGILDGVKSLSLRANMLASRLAREATGADEALLVTPHGRGPRGARPRRSSARST
jgi:branched-chain amino acid aminotransferase